MTVSINGQYSHEYINGVLVKKTLSAANETVNRGHYAATTLSAVDADLAAANILSGVTIFGFAGVATVQDIADADAVLADVKTGKFFYSVTGGRKTGNLATVALAAGANAYPAGYHVGAASLTAVDGDLVAGNIADGVTIFGVLGTLAATLTAEAQSGTKATYTPDSYSAATGYKAIKDIAGESDIDPFITKTDTFTAGSKAVAAFVGNVAAETPSVLKARLWMDGVQVAESAYIAAGGGTQVALLGDRSLSGSTIVKATVHNYSVTAYEFYFFSIANSTVFQHPYLVIGSVKT